MSGRHLLGRRPRLGQGSLLLDLVVDERERRGQRRGERGRRQGETGLGQRELVSELGGGPGKDFRSASQEEIREGRGGTEGGSAVPGREKGGKEGGKVIKSRWVAGSGHVDRRGKASWWLRALALLAGLNPIPTGGPVTVWLLPRHRGSFNPSPTLSPMIKAQPRVGTKSEGEQKRAEGDGQAGRKEGGR